MNDSSECLLRFFENSKKKARRGRDARGAFFPDFRDFREKWGSTPPCAKTRENRRKMRFLGEKVRKNGHFWHFRAKSFLKLRNFDKHSSPFKGGICAVQNPANLYSTKCRIFGPPPPPPGAPWWDTTPRRPPTASRSRKNPLSAKRPFFATRDFAD